MKKRTIILSSIVLALALLITASFTQIILGAPELSYSPDAAYEIELFDIWNDGTCYSSSYAITNLSSVSSAHVTHYFYTQDSLIPLLTYIDPVPLTPGESRIYDLAAIQDLPTDFYGSAVVTSDHPISGEVLPFPPCDIRIVFPSDIELLLTLTAYVSPEYALLPITYTWMVNNNPPIIHTGGISDSVELSWGIGGFKQITVNAKNSRGSVTVFLWIFTYSYETYIPMILR